MSICLSVYLSIFPWWHGLAVSSLLAELGVVISNHARV
jgi:hypothetical protein